LCFFDRFGKGFVLDGQLFVFVDFHLESSLIIEDSDQLSPEILIFLFQVDFSMTGRNVFARSERFEAFLAFVSGERPVDGVIAFRFLVRVFLW
jgi:hypothetical protein